MPVEFACECVCKPMTSSNEDVFQFLRHADFKYHPVIYFCYKKVKRKGCLPFHSISIFSMLHLSNHRYFSLATPLRSMYWCQTHRKKKLLKRLRLSALKPPPGQTLCSAHGGRPHHNPVSFSFVSKWQHLSGFPRRRDPRFLPDDSILPIAIVSHSVHCGSTRSLPDRLQVSQKQPWCDVTYRELHREIIKKFSTVFFLYMILISYLGQLKWERFTVLGAHTYRSWMEVF